MLTTTTVPMMQPTRWIGALRLDAPASVPPRAERPTARTTDDQGPPREVAAAPIAPRADVRRGA